MYSFAFNLNTGCFLYLRRICVVEKKKEQQNNSNLLPSIIQSWTHEDSVKDCHFLKLWPCF